MSTTRRPHRGIARAARALLVGAAALLLGTAALGSTAFAEDPPPTDPPTTVATDPPAAPAADPPVDTGDPVVQPALITAFTKAFSPSTIAPGDTSTLTFTITVDADASGLAFDDTLPTGMTVASAPTASQCGGTVTASAGSSTITFAGGSITFATSNTCTISVDVTSSTPGSHLNTSSTLSSTEPGGTPIPAATATLTVTPGFTKEFSPAQIDPSGVSTLTFTFDNTGNTAAFNLIGFTDTLPTSPGAMTVAATPNESTTCTGGTITATADSGTVSYSGGSVAANSTCTVQVDVTASTVGTYDNSTELTIDGAGTGTTATATLAVTPLFVSKTFVEGSIASGGTASFQITVRNDSTTEALSNVALVDALAPNCDRTFTTLAVGATETYTCSLANVTADFTNTIVATATGADSGVAVTAQASAIVTITTPTAGPALPLTGGSSTGLLAAAGIGVLVLGLLMVATSQRRRLLRR